MPLNAEAMTALIVGDGPLLAAKDAATAMARTGALFTQVLNTKIPMGGQATGIYTPPPPATPTSLTIPGASFVNKLSGIAITLTPASGGFVQVGLEVKKGCGTGTVNAAFGTIVGSATLSTAPGFAAMVNFPPPSKGTIRQLAIKNHLVLPIFTWLDTLISGLIIPVEGPQGPGVYAGSYTGMKFMQ